MSTRWTWLLLLVLAAGEAGAESSMIGRWEAAHALTPLPQTVSPCGGLGHWYSVLSLQPAADDSVEGFLIATRLTNTACSIKGAAKGRVAFQTKKWLVRGKPASDKRLRIVAYAGSCDGDFCDRSNEPYKAGAAEFQTDFVLDGEGLVDTFGTADPSDDSVFLRSEEFARRGADIERAATPFIDALARRDVAGAEAKVLPVIRNAQTRDSLQSFVDQSGGIENVTVLDRIATTTPVGDGPWTKRLEELKLPPHTRFHEVIVRVRGRSGGTANLAVVLAGDGPQAPVFAFMWW